ncbi:MAG: precorrin-6y C5,15-methyltransferase (decarboxylating) subunit CbiE [Gammaproteobacteria bacterium]|jgi:precorrin-6Y C5,15-methyltransferase (decarboxylating)|tara:strand:- start:15443 stop:16705 length:1263 start_codon:yes stop_codon:yes gene_type:complete
MTKITVIGLGICQPPLLNAKALSALGSCDCIMGSPRQLESIAHAQVVANQSRTQPASLCLPKLKHIAHEIKGFDHVVILASGDPLLFGIGKYLQSEFGDQVTCISGVSSLQGACELTGLSLQDAQLVSLHGRPLNHLKRHLQPHRTLLILTDQNSHPQAIAKVLVAVNLGLSKIHVCERLGYEDQNQQQFIAQDLATNSTPFASLHVTVVHTLGIGHVMPNFPGIADAHFVTDGESGKGLLTKREVRLNILSLLQPAPQDIAWDIGAGCGGVAIEWALWNPQGQVYAIEHHDQRIACLEANKEAFGVSANLSVIQDKAPDCLKELPFPDKVFIGGSGGELSRIMQLAWQRLKPGGRLATSAVTEPSKAALRQFSLHVEQQPTDYLQVAISRHDTIAGQDLLRPALPVTLMCWHKALEISS